MQYPKLHNQTADTSTQAMTEVALGLSMAFFSILIIALLSMQMPTTEVAGIDSKSSEHPIIDVKSGDADARADKSANDEPTIVFFYQNSFFDTDLRKISFAQANAVDNLVVAIPAATNFETAINLQKKFTVRQLSMTQIDQSWMNALAQTQNQDVAYAPVLGEQGGS